MVLKKCTNQDNKATLNNMYDTPPIIKTEHIIKVAEQLPLQGTSALNNTLTISIDSATYESNKNIAHITMSKAFKKSGIIRKYKGKYILLTYKDKPTDNKACPNINVPISDIARDINFSEDIVTIHIYNISQNIADKIREHLCLYINAETVRTVSAIVFPPPKIDKYPYNHLNP